MLKDMLGVAVRKLVTLPASMLGTVCDLLEKMADPDWVEATKKFLRKENPWTDVQKAAGLLKFVKEVKLPAIKTFSAKDRFKVGEIEGVKIGWFGDNFKAAFLTGDGKVERDVVEAVLRINEIRQSSVDGPIIAELGGEEMAETTLAQMYKMMKAQGFGQKGNLLVNSYANIFYIRDAKGVLWAVFCHWYSRYDVWHVGADPITIPRRWPDGSQVVSR